MSNQNIEVIRSAYEALARGDLEGMLAFVDDELEWTYFDPNDLGAGAQVCYGRHELESTLRHWGAHGFKPQLEEIEGRGERVMVGVRVPGIDAHLGAFPDDRAFAVFTVRNDRIVALRDCRDRDEAMDVLFRE
jgi:ketosteroid isomerase-like protein